MKFIFLFICVFLYCCVVYCNVLLSIVFSKASHWSVRDKEAKASSQLYRKNGEHTMHMMYLRMWLERGLKLTKCVFIAELVIRFFFANGIGL